MAVHQRKSSSKKKSAEAKESKNALSGAEDSSRNENDGGSGQNFKVPWKRILIRVVLCSLLIFVVYYSTNKGDPHVFARQKETLEFKSIEVPCSKEFLSDISKFKGCVPNSCGRLVTDIVITPEESAHLLRLCKIGLAYGGSSGGASILDLHSGALSHGNTFINIYEKLKAEKKSNIFTSTDFKVYSNVRNKIQKVIAYKFGIQANKLHLTHPTFFSEMTSKPAMTTHDEYWHVHIDKKTYPSFHYTSLLYLSNYDEDFTGGRFVFVDSNANITVEPKVGRVSAFTSGAENPHYVEQVKSGKRYAITVSFTCDPKQAITDPTTKKLQPSSSR